MSTILNAVNKTDITTEAISTEDTLSKIDSLNQKIDKGVIKPKSLTVGSLDVSALYSSVDTRTAGEMARNKIKQSSVNFQGVDYQWALVYLQVTMSPAEKVDAGVAGLMPRKINKQGQKPSVKTLKDKEYLQKWWFPKPTNFLTPEEKHLVIGCIAQQLVKVVFG